MGNSKSKAAKDEGTAAEAARKAEQRERILASQTRALAVLRKQLTAVSTFKAAGKARKTRREEREPELELVSLGLWCALLWVPLLAVARSHHAVVWAAVAAAMGLWGFLQMSASRQSSAARKSQRDATMWALALVSALAAAFCLHLSADPNRWKVAALAEHWSLLFNAAAGFTLWNSDASPLLHLRSRFSRSHAEKAPFSFMAGGAALGIVVGILSSRFGTHTSLVTSLSFIVSFLAGAVAFFFSMERCKDNFSMHKMVASMPKAAKGGNVCEDFIATLFHGLIAGVVAIFVVAIAMVLYGSLCLCFGIVVGIVTFVTLTFATHFLIPAAVGASGSGMLTLGSAWGCFVNFVQLLAHVACVVLISGSGLVPLTAATQKNGQNKSLQIVAGVRIACIAASLVMQLL
jgi:hypothetical protein